MLPPPHTLIVPSTHNYPLASRPLHMLFPLPTPPVRPTTSSAPFEPDHKQNLALPAPLLRDTSLLFWAHTASAHGE